MRRRRVEENGGLHGDAEVVLGGPCTVSEENCALLLPYP
jgi:hypothetical protein